MITREDYEIMRDKSDAVSPVVIGAGAPAVLARLK